MKATLLRLIAPALIPLPLVIIPLLFLLIACASTMTSAALAALLSGVAA